MPDTDPCEMSRKLYRHGREAMSRSAFAAALAHLEESAKLYPHFKTLELLGECRMKLDDNMGAIVPLAAAAALNRGVRAPSLLAEAFTAVGMPDKAMMAAKEALKRDDGNRRAKAVLEKLAAEGFADNPGVERPSDD